MKEKSRPKKRSGDLDINYNPERIRHLTASFKSSLSTTCNRAKIFCVLLIVFISAMDARILAQDEKITNENIEFIEYPDYPEAHSTWGSIGYNPKFNTVHIGVTNHHDNVALYEYDVATDEMNLDGFIRDMANLRSFQWQGKIHSKILTDDLGNIYFSTDGGESREEYLMNHPHGYSGGFWMKYNPSTGRLSNLGMGLRNESIKDLDRDPFTGILYGITYPQAHFLVFDPAKNDLIDLGRLASSHVPRVLFTDRWGNCYYVDWRQRLVKYEKNSGELVFDNQSVPAFPGTPGSKIITGITAYAKDPENEIIYLVTYGAKILSFRPKKEGIGAVTDLGGVIETGNAEKWDPYVPNLNLGNNGKLYYFIGGHGNYIREDKTVLVEFDPKSGMKNILFEFPTTTINEVTGHDVKDREGNLYFAGRREVLKGSKKISPFMIKFNPEKKLRK